MASEKFRTVKVFDPKTGHVRKGIGLFDFVFKTKRINRDFGDTSTVLIAAQNEEAASSIARVLVRLGYIPHESAVVKIQAFDDVTEKKLHAGRWLSQAAIAVRGENSQTFLSWECVAQRLGFNPNELEWIEGTNPGLVIGFLPKKDLSGFDPCELTNA